MLHISLYKRIFVAVLMMFSLMASAESLPSKNGERARFAVQIDIKQAYISGICGMLYEDGVLKSSIVNEFGFSAMDFEYNPQKDKVKIISVVKNLDHWYIKRMLRHDLRELLHNLQKGEGRYENTKRNITYTFTPMTNANVSENENNDTSE